MDTLKALAEIQKATLQARSRTGDKTISTRAESGKIQIVRVVFDKSGKSAVTPASDWMMPANVATALAAI